MEPAEVAALRVPPRVPVIAPMGSGALPVHLDLGVRVETAALAVPVRRPVLEAGAVSVEAADRSERPVRHQDLEAADRVLAVVAHLRVSDRREAAHLAGVPPAARSADSAAREARLEVGALRAAVSSAARAHRAVPLAVVAPSGEVPQAAAVSARVVLRSAVDAVRLAAHRVGVPSAVPPGDGDNTIQ